jgi:magnesium transporter
MATALIFALLIFVYNYFSSGNLNLTFTVSISRFIVIIFASFFGTVIHLLLNRLKIDPHLQPGHLSTPQTISWGYRFT